MHQWPDSRCPTPEPRGSARAMFRTCAILLHDDVDGLEAAFATGGVVDVFEFRRAAHVL